LSQSHAPQNLTSIQSLRGLAALAVCFSHLWTVEGKFSAQPILTNWAESGGAGVDLFFVISGFIMVWVTQNRQRGPQALSQFWLSRFFRIYPLWWLVLSALVVVWLVKPEWVYSSRQSEPEILKSYLLFPAAEVPLHAVGWTLIHEVWFYLVFGLFLLIPSRWLPANLTVWFLCVVILAIMMPTPSNPIIALIRHPLTLEFILGAGVGLLAIKRTFIAPRLIGSFGCFVFLLSMLAIRSDPGATLEAEWDRVGLFGIPAAMIVWGWVGRELEDQESSSGWSQKMGDWSYALYLIHIPVFVSVGRVAAPFSRDGILDNVAFLIVALVGAITAAYILHTFFEKPVAKFAAKLLRKPSS
jgi:exopolysaccharide production protein ExoZ